MGGIFMRTVTAYIWSLFVIYWVLSALHTRRKVKKDGSGQERIPRALHLFLVFIAFAVTYSNPEIMRLNEIILPHNWVIEYTGGIILFLSLLFAIWARIVLGKNWSGAIQKVEGQRLIKCGPYKHIRNPIYTGVICGFFGTFLTLGTIASFLGLCIVSAAFLVKIKNEQRFLIMEFGEEYKQYIKETWALLPYIF